MLKSIVVALSLISMKFQVMEGSESAVTVSVSCMVVPAGTIVPSGYVLPVDEKEKASWYH